MARPSLPVCVPHSCLPTHLLLPAAHEPEDGPSSAPFTCAYQEATQPLQRLPGKSLSYVNNYRIVINISDDQQPCIKYPPCAGYCTRHLSFTVLLSIKVDTIITLTIIPTLQRRKLRLGEIRKIA